MFAKQKAGDEIAADDEEDEDAGGAIEDAHPKERNGERDLKALDAVESENEKDGERPETVETRMRCTGAPPGRVVSTAMSGSFGFLGASLGLIIAW